MSVYSFNQIEMQYMEPPEVQHDDRCEALRWYWCSSCDHPFAEDSDLSGVKSVVNMHDCGQAFNKRYDECVCGHLDLDWRA